MHLPAGKLRTPTPTTALTILNISLLIVAVPPPSPPLTCLALFGVTDDDVSTNARFNPGRGIDVSEDDDTARRASTAGDVVHIKRRSILLDRSGFILYVIIISGLVDDLKRRHHHI